MRRRHRPSGARRPWLRRRAAAHTVSRRGPPRRQGWGDRKRRGAPGCAPRAAGWPPRPAAGRPAPPCTTRTFSARRPLGRSCGSNWTVCPSRRESKPVPTTAVRWKNRVRPAPSRRKPKSRESLLTVPVKTPAAGPIGADRLLVGTGPPARVDDRAAARALSSTSARARCRAGRTGRAPWDGAGPLRQGRSAPGAASAILGRGAAGGCVAPSGRGTVGPAPPAARSHSARDHWPGSIRPGASGRGHWARGHSMECSVAPAPRSAPGDCRARPPRGPRVRRAPSGTRPPVPLGGAVAGRGRARSGAAPLCPKPALGRRGWRIRRLRWWSRRPFGPRVTPGALVSVLRLPPRRRRSAHASARGDARVRAPSRRHERDCPAPGPFGVWRDEAAASHPGRSPGLHPSPSIVPLPRGASGRGHAESDRCPLPPPRRRVGIWRRRRRRRLVRSRECGTGPAGCRPSSPAGSTPRRSSAVQLSASRAAAARRIGRPSCRLERTASGARRPNGRGSGRCVGKVPAVRFD